jgi:molybdopterin-guanine dinucleotide biosynthesis protein A
MILPHTKHQASNKANIGYYHRCEWAITGSSCEEIKLVAEQIASTFPEKKVAYMDADHHTEEKTNLLFHIHHKHQCVQTEYAPKEQWEWRVALNDFDFVLTNGNHFPASRWIVLSNPEKEKSVKKRIQSVSEIDIVFIKKKGDIASYLKEWIGLENVPFIEQNNTSEWREKLLLRLQPSPIKGLIMAGGMSARMGQDKANMHYHGKNQIAYLAEQFENLGIQAHVSCRSNQAQELVYPELPIIEDSILQSGPVGGLISAFRFDPNAAWLVVACDLPHFCSNAMQQLIASRKIEAIATAFNSPFDAYPEPLACIWEPKSFLKLTQYLAFGNTCPRKVLLQNDSFLLEAENPLWLLNANTPEEAQKAKESISKGAH